MGFSEGNRSRAWRNRSRNAHIVESSNAPPAVAREHLRGDREPTPKRSRRGASIRTTRMQESPPDPRKRGDGQAEQNPAHPARHPRASSTQYTPHAITGGHRSTGLSEPASCTGRMNFGLSPACVPPCLRVLVPPINNPLAGLLTLVLRPGAGRLPDQTIDVRVSVTWIRRSYH